MKNQISFELLFCTVALFCQALATFSDLDDVRSGNCVESVHHNLNANLAFYGWPHVFDCHYLVLDFEDFYDFEDTIPINCQIWSANGTLLSNDTEDFGNFYDYIAKIYEVPAIVEGNTDFIILASSVGGTTCVFQNVSLNASHPYSCEEFAQSQQFRRSPPSTLGEPEAIHCRVPLDVYPKIPFGNNLVTYQWHRSCSMILENETNKILAFDSLEQKDAGTYLCSITYNGMTRFLYQTSVCVREPIPIAAASVYCERTTLFKEIGQSASFACGVDFHKGQPRVTDVAVRWKKVNSTQLHECSHEPNENKLSAKPYCQINFSDQPCSSDPSYIPPANASIVPFFLSFKDISESDFGEYEINVFTLYDFRDSPRRFNLTLSQNEVFEALDTSVIALIAVLVLVFVLIVVSLLICLKYPQLKDRRCQKKSQKI